MSLTLDAPAGIGEVVASTDLVGLVVEALPDLADGDVVVVTSKIVSKAEGRVVHGDRDDVLPDQTVRVVARRGGTRIVVNHLGLVMAAAGIDASNVAPGSVLLLPADPDRTARELRAGLRERTGRNVAVLIGDTAGRAWRHGQTDIAIGAAGIDVLDDHAGQTDPYGNPLAVTAPAIADEIAAAAELVAGKLAGRPLVRVRGLADRVLAAGDNGPGAAALVRPLAEDMFALGAREAVLHALAGGDPAAYGATATHADMLVELTRLGLEPMTDGDSLVVDLHEATAGARLALAAHVLGWTTDVADSGRATLRPRVP